MFCQHLVNLIYDEFGELFLERKRFIDLTILFRNYGNRLVFIQALL